MYTEKRVKFNKLYIFDAKIIHIPSSFNRVGTDPLPRYFVRPTKLREILNHSSNPSSVNFGYKRDKKSGFYVKNIKEVDKIDVQAQFDLFSIAPPFWFYDENSYVSFVEGAMNSTYSEQVEILFSNKKKKYFVDENVDEDVTTKHFYVKHIDFISQPFFVNVWKEYPKFNNVETYDMATSVAGQIST